LVEVMGCDHTKAASRRQMQAAGRNKSPPREASFPEGFVHANMNSMINRTVATMESTCVRS
jgi:hypothetical protein